MTTYIMLLNWTDQGVKNVRESPRRLDAARKQLADMGGTFKEIAAPDRIVHTELFDQDWTGGETVQTTRFEEQGGRTTVTVTVRYSSKEAREGALKTGMMDGWGVAYDRLAELLASGKA